MAEATHRIVDGDESDVHDEPHLAGRRITVLRIASLVEEGEMDPDEVADQFELPIADVYRALTYYHDHPEVMDAAERKRERRERQARERGAPTIDELVDEHTE